MEARGIMDASRHRRSIDRRGREGALGRPAVSAVFLAASLIARSGFSNPVTTVPWNGYAGAATFTFDDACKSQLDNVVPALKARGIRATFFLYDVGNAFSNNKVAWIAAAKDGNELANHSVDHVDFSKLPRSVPLRIRLDETTFGKGASVYQDGARIQPQADGSFVVEFMKLAMEVRRQVAEDVASRSRGRSYRIAHSSGEALVPGIVSGRLELVDVHGVVRTLPIVDGKSDLRRIPSGVYRARIPESGASGPGAVLALP